MNPLIRRSPPSANTFPTRTSLAMIAAVAAVVLLLLTACAGDDQGVPASADPSATPSPPQVAAADPAPTSAPPPAVESSSPDETLNVVASNVLLADLVRQVGGELVSVDTLVKAGADAHTWQSTPRDSVRIAQADLIVSNGAGLASQVDALIANAASREAVQVVASEGLEPQELVELPFPGGDHHEEEEHELELAGRLLVGDGETGSLAVIDLETETVQDGAFDLGSRAGRIYPTKSGRFAIAVSSDANNIHAIDGGIYLEEHGDHEDLVEREVSRLGIDLPGDNPVHLYVGGEWAAVFYDGSGDIALINEHELEEAGASYEPVVLNAGPHHGAAVPLEDDLIAVTMPHPDFALNPSDYRLPIGAEIRDLEGNVLYSAEGCPDLHGDAGNGHMAVFGCTGGVLMIEAHDGEFEHAFISAPNRSPDDFRLTSVWGYAGLDHFFALGSAVGLYVVDPEAGEMEQLIPANEDLRPIQVTISHDGELLLIVMSDGEVRMYEAHDLDLLAASSDILGAEIDPSFWARPHIATAPGRIFITDSAAGEVIALESHDLEEADRWEVAGKPTKIAFVGLLEQGDHPEEGHDHKEGDPHFWQNPRMVVHYVNQITNGLVAADPANAGTYLDSAAAYIAELEALDAYIVDALAPIPHGRRVMVTFHDAFGYFGERYDVEVQAFVSAHAEDVSPDDIANVLEMVEQRSLTAVFAEPQFSADALQQVARDTSIQVGIIRSLPDDEYPDYISMMRANADQLALVLR